MDKPDIGKLGQREKIVSLLRWAGFALIVLAVVLFFDIAGLAAGAGLTQGGIHHILGGMLFVMGVVDVTLIPRVFENIFRSDRK